MINSDSLFLPREAVGPAGGDWEAFLSLETEEVQVGSRLEVVRSTAGEEELKGNTALDPHNQGRQDQTGRCCSSVQWKAPKELSSPLSSSLTPPLGHRGLESGAIPSRFPKAPPFPKQRANGGRKTNLEEQIGHVSKPLCYQLMFPQRLLDVLPSSFFFILYTSNITRKAANKAPTTPPTITAEGRQKKRSSLKSVASCSLPMTRKSAKTTASSPPIRTAKERQRASQDVLLWQLGGRAPSIHCVTNQIRIHWHYTSTKIITPIITDFEISTRSCSTRLVVTLLRQRKKTVGCCGRLVLSVGTARVSVVMGTLGLKGTLVLTVVVAAAVVGAAVVGSGVVSVVVDVSSSVVVSMSKPGKNVEGSGDRSSQPAEGAVLSAGLVAWLVVTTVMATGDRGTAVVCENTPLSPSASVGSGGPVGSSGLGLGSTAGEAEGAGPVAWVVERRRGSSVVKDTPTDVGLILSSGTGEEKRGF
ncbi:hypothetical protein FQN60_007482 [Etheostoma spectabile]|uniref:Uncharacterized protein n=1 Tax=Etheostoma spectabile TaxID=54343 RepID=A0A5J5CYD0_9PERO|nr:hypothetical protein FQN60_007482 [Etheostoma spectabile]